MKKEKITNLLLYIVFFITILFIILIKPLGNLDELWNYNFARNIANGLIPYRDFNMLQMPLLPLICGIILKITTNQLVTMRVLAALLCSGIFYMIYKVFYQLNVKKEISILLTLWMIVLFKDIVCIDYNYATLLIALLLVFYEIKWGKETEESSQNNPMHMNTKHNLIVGILAGLAITLKQTSGICISIVCLGYPLLLVHSREELKTYLTLFLARLAGVVIPVGSMMIYLAMNNAIADFISYTMQGVSGFSNYISYARLLQPNIIGLLSILVPITMLVEWVRVVILDQDRKQLVLLAYGMAMFVVTFPISDTIHFLIGSTIILILLLCELVKIIKKIISKKEMNTMFSLLAALSICLIVVYTGNNSYQYFRKQKELSKLNHFQYIPTTQNLEKQIEIVDNYITSCPNKVKMLDASAAIYMIPINQYHKDYDMLLKGNLGNRGEDKLIEEINQSTNIQYFILKDQYAKNWQTPLEVIDFTKNNKSKIGELLIYDIYQ